MSRSVTRTPTRSILAFGRIAAAVVGTAFLTAAVLLVAGSALAQPPGPCTEDPSYRALDFWQGEWRVVGADGETIGHDRIESAEGGCLVLERWTSSSGETALGLNYLDPATAAWHQVRVDSRGGVVRTEGRASDAGVRYEGVSVRPDGSSDAARVVLEPMADGRLRHTIEHRTAAGIWVTTFDGTYERLGAAHPVAEPTTATIPAEGSAGAPSDEDAPEPQPVSTPAAGPAEPASEVKALSAKVTEEELAPASRRRVPMASPMTLDVPLGPLELYPQNAAWTTDETAPYLCRGVTLRELGAARRVRRGKATLEARLLLHTEQRAQRVGVVVELLDADGQTVARAEERRVSLGLLVSAYDPDSGLLQTLDLEIDQELFDRLFAGDRRPSLRVTIEPR